MERSARGPTAERLSPLTPRRRNRAHAGSRRDPSDECPILGHEDPQSTLLYRCTRPVPSSSITGRRYHGHRTPLVDQLGRATGPKILAGGSESHRGHHTAVTSQEAPADLPASARPVRTTPGSSSGPPGSVRPGPRRRQRCRPPRVRRCGRRGLEIRRRRLCLVRLYSRKSGQARQRLRLRGDRVQRPLTLNPHSGRRSRPPGTPVVGVLDALAPDRPLAAHCPPMSPGPPIRAARLRPCRPHCPHRQSARSPGSRGAISQTVDLPCRARARALHELPLRRVG